MPAASPSPVVSVVVPIHNEAGILEESVAAILAELEGVGQPFQLVLAENGSTDDTALMADHLAADSAGVVSAIHLPEPDYGAAMRAAFDEATGEWRVLFDIDYYSGDFVAEALRREQDADIVLASKRAPGANDQRSPFRRFATWAFNLILLVLFGSRVSDTHGMKAVRRGVVAEIGPRVRSTMDLYDTELVLRAERAGYRIVEIPARVEELRATSQSFVRRVPRTLVGLFRIRIRLWQEAWSSRS
jgi:glycosyltransferase involved in cell wall biosynthesis